MTAPRQVLPGTTYLVTRRCSQRQFLLKPSRATTEVFLYLLAVAADRFAVQLHAYCVLSNHYHLVLTDPEARLPAFHQFLDGLLARALNAWLGRSEHFWALNSYSAVALATPEDVIDKAAYTLANPVAAGLVRSGSLWPGAWSAPAAMGGEPLEVRRPEYFFDPNGSLPPTATLRLTIPPGFTSRDEFISALASALSAREEQARIDVGGRFLGVARVLAQEPTSRAASEEVLGTLRPRVACRDKWKRCEVLARLVEFLRSYRAAWLARKAGDANVCFPCGTYLLRVAHGVPCVAPG